MEPIIGKVYKHFKGNLYEVKAIAKHSETGELMVVYEALYGDYQIYVRPYDSFVSKVDKHKYPEACQEYRFEEYHEEEALPIDPKVMAFLDTDVFQDKYAILDEMRYRITDDMINIMAASLDMFIDENLSTAKRYDELLGFVALRKSFESSRLH